MNKDNELAILLEYLRRPHQNPKTAKAPRDLADDLKIWKTDTITRFFPLTRRAAQIIEARLDSNSNFILSKNGEPSGRRLPDT